MGSQLLLAFQDIKTPAIYSNIFEYSYVRLRSRLKKPLVLVVTPSNMLWMISFKSRVKYLNAFKFVLPSFEMKDFQPEMLIFGISGTTYCTTF